MNFFIVFSLLRFIRIVAYFEIGFGQNGKIFTGVKKVNKKSEVNFYQL